MLQVPSVFNKTNSCDILKTTSAKIYSEITCIHPTLVIYIPARNKTQHVMSVLRYNFSWY